ncbi:bifunctional diaminohydroxyphosphoribosylaminopyrimidine deaminase/5-amino-6-(5-phosphoribosylamino)uracil reductase RibD [Coxiella-like endosymbiont]|uniref:bifunctional diaminohydroxyphosphoribosylaminopyrimidine deaminase/5-amino-6-(5-phosphoribosylamino)uracil reductase RibD n=1 Tax=Coxiella-like endosymbiont TaxID=1592897 RepID=UPI00272A5166|nr:bifunctional diaminohydroxyphosphoribosylaminopyrimidine deaminase/5-amino-6-(5-phosphoribosylamino)uracil reductase RibD [Coxiella-like endosymbiont]
MNNSEVYLKQALEFAEIRRGFCAPNPAVGAILVKDNKIISTGFHKRNGLPHAEVEAINSAGENVKGADLYVTLEPCCHYGKTPPCTDLIIKTGIKSVYYSLADPNPNVFNKGAQALKQAGIDCFLLEIPEIKSFYKSYSYWTANKRSWITIKLALSLDGKIAGIKGKPVALTGEELKLYTHEFRKKVMRC